MRSRVRVADGRQLVVERLGDPRGRPVFLLHGMPGSRLGPAPRGMVLYQRKTQLITYDRPGYGDLTGCPAVVSPTRSRMYGPSRITWDSTGSPWWAGPVGRHTPWPAPR